MADGGGGLPAWRVALPRAVRLFVYFKYIKWVTCMRILPSLIEPSAQQKHYVHVHTQVPGLVQGAGAQDHHRPPRRPRRPERCVGAHAWCACHGVGRFGMWWAYCACVGRFGWHGA